MAIEKKKSHRSPAFVQIPAFRFGTHNLGTDGNNYVVKEIQRSFQ
jgi:hypothetical protein